MMKDDDDDDNDDDDDFDPDYAETVRLKSSLGESDDRRRARHFRI